MNGLQKKILIVEDETSLRNVLKEKLTQEDFEVLEAVNGDEGLKMAQSEHPDLILLDILMPVKDGFTLVKELRTYEKEKGITLQKQIPIIFLTNLSEEKGFSESQERGIYDYLVKTDWTLDKLILFVKDKLQV